MNVANVVTLGGVAVGTGLVIYHAILWWPGLKSLQADVRGAVADALPFVAGWCFGALLVMCAGGIVGWVADAALWLGNWLGDAALVWGVGGQAGDDVTRRGPQQALTNGGHLMVLLALFAFCAALRKLGGHRRKALSHGALSGTMLGLSSSVLATAAVPLASAMNVAGAWFSTGTLS